MSYWPHSNPEPAPAERSAHVDESTVNRAACPGICNRDWRMAEREHRRAEDLEKQLAALQERAPRPVHCKACLDQTPGHGTDPVPGAPIWCGPCAKRIARSLLSMPDLYVQLELDKMHGTRTSERDPNSGHSPKAAAAPSPSPPVDEQDSVGWFLAGWEDAVRDAFGFSHRPARLPQAAEARPMVTPPPDRCPWPRPAHYRGDVAMARTVAAVAATAESETMMGAVRFLTVHLEAVLAHEQLARDFGRALLAEATELRRRTAMHEQRTRKKAPCPRCRLKTLVHEGGEDYVACENPSYGLGPCGRLLSLAEYDDLEAGMGRHGTVHSTATGQSA